MATSWRSGSSSSFGSSALSAPVSHAQHASPVDSTFTPTSAAISALTAESSAPQTPPAPLDLGPPGYHATIKLFERTPNEMTVYLGPWEIVGANPRRLLWQCSYAGEVLEHFLPSDNPNELFPHTLHAQHRRFGDPREMELYLTFLEPHRIRYMTTDGIVHDEYIEVKYEFTTIEGSIQLQSDIRRRDLVDWFDADVVWSDTHRRTDSYGNVRGLGTIQRIKLWRDRYSTFHYLTFYANQRRRWKEYLLDDFDTELRQRDDRHRRIQLGARGARRGSASESSSGRGQSRDRRFSATSIFRSRHSTATTNGGGASSLAQSALDIRYLGIQFSRNPSIQAGSDGQYCLGSSSVVFLEGRLAGSLPKLLILGSKQADERKDYSRFIQRWNSAHAADAQFEATFPTNHVELPSPYLNGYQTRSPHVNGVSELSSPGTLAPVAEPSYDGDSDETP